MTKSVSLRKSIGEHWSVLFFHHLTFVLVFYFFSFRSGKPCRSLPFLGSKVGQRVVVVHDERSAHPEVCEIVRWHENMGSCLGVLGPWRNLEAKVGSPFAFSGVRPLKVERLESAVEVLFATVSNCSRWE